MARSDGISRRGFQAKSSTGVGGGVAGLYAAHRSDRAAVAEEPAGGDGRPPREVWVASMGQMKLQSGAKTPLNVCRAMIVVWPSAFGGGMMLNSPAWINKYYVVNSTRGEHPTKIPSAKTSYARAESAIG